MEIVEDSSGKFSSAQVRAQVVNGVVLRSAKTDQLYLKGPTHLTLLSNGDNIHITDLDNFTSWVMVKAKVIVE